MTDLYLSFKFRGEVGVYEIQTCIHGRQKDLFQGGALGDIS